MSLVISDHEVFYDAASTQHPYAGSVSAIATLVPLSLKQGDGTYQIDARGGKRFPPVSLIDGSWALTLPWPSEASPGQNPWAITRSDGTAVTGLVPEGVSGPLTVQNLVTSYGWGFVPPQTAAQVQVVTGPQGIKGDPGTAPTASANTVVAGPSSGAPAQATPRALIAGDIPTLPPSQITGTAVITTDNRLSDQRTPLDGSVSTAKIADGAVADAKIAGLSSSKLSGLISAAILPIATAIAAGLVKIGAGLSVAVDGTISVATATFTALGLTRQVYYNVIDFGADPTGTASSSLAFQQAYNAAAVATTTLTRGIVKAPAGIYLLPTYMQPTGSNIALEGDGKNVTILQMVSPTYPNGLFAGSPNLTRNSIRRLTIDANGPGGSVVTGGASLITMSANSDLEDVEICNRAGSVNSVPGNISGTVGVLFAAGRGRVRNCDFHDDFHWQTVSAGSIAAPGTPGQTALSVIPVASTANFAFANAQGNQTVHIDPPVAAMTGAAITVTTPGTPQAIIVTPLTDNDNTRPGTGRTTGMFGIGSAGPTMVLGRGIVISATAGGTPTGYAPGTYFNVAVTGGTFTTQAKAKVVVNSDTTISPGGITITAQGFNYTAPPTGLDTTSFIGSGSGLTVSFVSDPLENVTPTASTNSTFTANVSYNHPQYSPLAYQGVPELGWVVGVDSGSSTVSVLTQLAHASGVVMIGAALNYDMIAADGQGSGQRFVEDLIVEGCRAARLSEDLVGGAVARRLTIKNNHSVQCPSGLAMTATSDWDISGNVIDGFYFGRMPWNLSDSAYTSYFAGQVPPNQIFSGIFSIAGATVYPEAGQATYDRALAADNRINGFSYGVLSANSVLQRHISISGGAITNSGVNAVYLQGVKNVSIGGGITIGDANAYNLPNQNTLPVAAVLLVGTSAATAVDAVLIDGAAIADTRGGSPSQMQAALYALGVNVTNVRWGANVVTGITTALIQYPASGGFAPPVGAIRLLNDGGSLVSTAVNYSVAFTDSTVVVTASGKTVTLPTPAGASVGHLYTVKNSAAGASTSVVVSGGGTIDGQSTITLPVAYSAATFETDGTSWYIAGRVPDLATSGTTGLVSIGGSLSVSTTGQIGVALPTPGLSNCLAWTCDPAVALQTFTPTAQRMQLWRVQLPYNATIHTVSTLAAAIGATVSGTYLALYDTSGNQLAVSGDLSAQLTGTTPTVTWTLGTPLAFGAAASTCYVALVVTSAGTMPTFSSVNAQAYFGQSSALPRSGYLAGVAGAPPASVTLTSLTAAGQTVMMTLT